MRTLAEIKGRPNIYAPDYTRGNGALRTQCGMRAVWHCVNQKAVPEGYRVFGDCDEPTCCNPAHIKCTSVAAYGAHQQRTGKLKGQTARILANRAICRQRALLTPEQVVYVQTSKKTGIVLAKELGISTTALSRYRRGESICVRADSGLFSGLIAGGRA